MIIFYLFFYENSWKIQLKKILTANKGLDKELEFIELPLFELPIILLPISITGNETGAESVIAGTIGTIVFVEFVVGIFTEFSILILEISLIILTLGPTLLIPIFIKSSSVNCKNA